MTILKRFRITLVVAFALLMMLLTACGSGEATPKDPTVQIVEYIVLGVIGLAAIISITVSNMSSNRRSGRQATKRSSDNRTSDAVESARDYDGDGGGD